MVTQDHPPVLGQAGHTPAVLIGLRRLIAIFEHAARSGLPAPTADTQLPDSRDCGDTGEPIALVMDGLDALTEWAKHLGSPVFDERIDARHHWWTAGDFLDLRIVVEFETVAASVPVADGETLIAGVA